MTIEALSCLQSVTLLQVEYEVVLLNVVLPQVLLHILFLFLVQVINHVLKLRLWRGLD